MSDLQSKFAMTVVAFGLFLAYVFPMMKEADQDHDAVVSHIGQVYVPPTPNDPTAPSGFVSADDLQKYAVKKAEERKRQAMLVSRF